MTKTIDLFNVDPLDPKKQSPAFLAGVDAVRNMAQQDNDSVIPPARQVEAGFVTLKNFIGSAQLSVMGTIYHGEEKAFISDKVAEYADRVSSMPKTYEQDGKGDNAVAYLHYFKGGMDWYITEKDIESEQNQAFGLADLGMGHPEMGYISINELIENDVELDLHFVPQTIGKIKEFLRAAGRLAIAATVAVSLSACMSPAWEKSPKLSAAAWEQVKADCALEAVNRVQPRYAFAVDTGSAFQSTSCHKNNCSTYSGYTPPSVEHIDLNVPLRKQVKDACLARHGGIKNTL